MTAAVIKILEEGVRRIANSATALEVAFDSDDMTMKEKGECLLTMKARLTQLSAVALAFAFIDLDKKDLEEFMPKLASMVVDVQENVILPNSEVMH